MNVLLLPITFYFPTFMDVNEVAENTLPQLSAVCFLKATRALYFPTVACIPHLIFAPVENVLFSMLQRSRPRTRV